VKWGEEVSLSTRLDGITSAKTARFMFKAVRVLNIRQPLDKLQPRNLKQEHAECVTASKSC